MTCASALRWLRCAPAGVATLVAVCGAAAAAGPAAVPAPVARRLPPGFEVLSSARLELAAPQRRFLIVALGRRNESRSTASARPLLIFEARGADFVLVGRNDAVVLKADEGGQCDPFLDGDGVIAVKGRYFTVQNGVACGEHWTDYVTFRFDDRRGGFVFDSARWESWKLNPSDAPEAEALVRDGPPRVDRPPRNGAPPFSTWSPKP